ncbi:GGDEF domain-containing protein [Kitasatospora sp. NPDC053057]|uniref:GGDEF domain-containing protein n=1 Tax=Kitasatospora sp. NPDC053057 TaxID=3364062 RepID=UPI0037C75CD3
MLLAERDDLARRLEDARRDPLTGLPTRAAFTATAERLLATAAAPAVLMLDLVDFKAVNDPHGHEVGDAVLTATGRRLADWAGPGAVVSRLGGDEFAAVLDTDPASLPARIADLRSLLEQPVDHHGTTVAVDASIGSATPAGHLNRSLPALLHAADLAMYADKGRGRRGRRQHTPTTA